MPVPKGEKAIFLMTLSAEAGVWCTQTGFGWARILVDGATAFPDRVAFEARIPNTLQAISRSHQFVAGPVNAGQHTVTVQFMTDVNCTFGLVRPILSVLRIKTG
jgi:hypothetical protein